ncbi:hypothetical protein ACIBJF_49480 [Streptomyces sp. NPDC050743]|uniref:hypothetical protein n=1 Tax=Streptomyces sp. NPDC050743 TaxID=3365634 RepID=UPI0037BE0C9D
MPDPDSHNAEKRATVSATQRRPVTRLLAAAARHACYARGINGARTTSANRVSSCVPDGVLPRPSAGAF